MTGINRFFLLQILFFNILLCMPGLFGRTWTEIRKSGKLFVLTMDSDRQNGLHRVMMPIDREQALLKSFAFKHKLKIEYIQAPVFKAMFPMLNEGKGDLISANLSVTKYRQKNFLLSTPFDYTSEVVFTASDSQMKTGQVRSLCNRIGWILPNTSYLENLRYFTYRMKNIYINELSSTISHEDLIELVARKKISYSVLNECDLDAWLAYRTGIRKLFFIKKPVPLVFAAKKDSVELIRLLNDHINNTYENSNKKQSSIQKNIVLNKDTTTDLSAIKKRGYIRMLTTNDIFTCYLHKGNICGFEYELAKRFAESIGVTVITVIPRNFNELTKYLSEGKGDFIAANFTVTPERIKQFKNLDFCSQYHGVREVLVGRKKERITKISHLAGRRVYVRKGNSYYQTLLKLRKNVSFRIVTVPENERSIDILRKVEKGTYDLTVVDDTFLNQAVNNGYKVKHLLYLTEIQPFSWIVRKKNPQLSMAIKEFFKKENKSAFFNMRKKYYYGSGHAKKVLPLIVSDKKTAISKYDAIFKKYAKIYNFNWYFIAAQSYQESHFATNLVNPIGATGLMQVMPKTAKDLGIRNLKNPENGVHAGTKYMSILRNRIDDHIAVQDQLCFALAAYNAGYGHLLDARKLAVQLGLDPDIWFNNTEKAFALLENPQYYSKAKFGYCRASETIPYVRNIMNQAHHYEKIMNLQNKKRSSK